MSFNTELSRYIDEADLPEELFLLRSNIPPLSGNSRQEVLYAAAAVGRALADWAEGLAREQQLVAAIDDDVPPIGDEHAPPDEDVA